MIKPLFKEVNAIFKKKFTYRIAILFPSTYQASLSSLALQIIYFMLNSFDEVYAERVVYNSRETPISIETRTPLTKFDLILTTSHYELEYPVIVAMLMKSGIEPLAEKRNKIPIIAGGPPLTAEPSPMGRVADVILRGEFENVAEKIVNSLPLLGNKKDFVDSLKGAGPFWSTDNQTKEISIVKDLDNAFYPVSQIQSLEEEPVFGRALLVETSRGCNRGCFFCLEAAISLFRRERSYERLRRIIEEGARVNGLNRVSFYSISFLDSKTGERLLELVSELGFQASIPSVRVESLNEYNLSLIKQAGQKTVTIAPESGSPKLRAYLNKKIPEDKIFEVAKIINELGMGLKLYYMVGIPGEGKEELDSIISEVKKIWEIFKNKKRVKVSINPFIPKPLTHLSREKMMPAEELRRRISYLRKSLAPISEVDFYNPKLAHIQYKINLLGIEAYDFILGEAIKLMNKKG